MGRGKGETSLLRLCTPFRSHVGTLSNFNDTVAFDCLAIPQFLLLSVSVYK